jgi:hypothetical protein
MSNNLGVVILSGLIVGRANTTWWSVVGGWRRRHGGGAGAFLRWCEGR